MPAPDERLPVLIVGGGYAGLACSLFLSHHGVRSLLVDRHPGVSIQGRARGINPRTMEIYRPLGLAQAVADAGWPFVHDRGVARCRTLAGEWEWIVQGDAPMAYPDWTAGEFVLADQSSVEPILVQAARARGAEQRFNTVLASFDVDPNGVTAVIEDRESGQRSTVRADYLVAADGNRSSVRERLGIVRPGPGIIRRFVAILFDADLSDIVRRRALFWIVANERVGSGGGGFATTATPNRWAAAVFHDPRTYDPTHDSPEAYTKERCVQLIRTLVGRQDLAVDIVDVDGWEEAVGVADRFGKGRVFLVGDSAHVWPPAGGMGANSAVHDAHNLAWKLAAVVQGWAGTGLLDSYEAERRPVALKLAELTVRRQEARFGQGRDPEDIDDLVCILGQRYRSAAVVAVEPGSVFGASMEAEARPGLRAPHLWLGLGGERIAAHDLFDRAFVLLTGREGGAWCKAASLVSDRTAIPVRAYRVGPASQHVELTDLDGAWLARSGLSARGAVLVRPDGYVAWRADDVVERPEAALLDVLHRVLDASSD